MTSKTRIFLVSILLAFSVLIAWCYLGVYQDREFDDYYLFVKHELSSHFYFHSPVGESDLQLFELNHSDRESELLYREFVDEGRGWKRSLLLPNLAKV